MKLNNDNQRAQCKSTTSFAPHTEISALSTTSIASVIDTNNSGPTNIIPNNAGAGSICANNTSNSEANLYSSITTDASRTSTPTPLRASGLKMKSRPKKHERFNNSGIINKQNEATIDNVNNSSYNIKNDSRDNNRDYVNPIQKDIAANNFMEKNYTKDMTVHTATLTTTLTTTTTSTAPLVVIKKRNILPQSVKNLDSQAKDTLVNQNQSQKSTPVVNLPSASRIPTSSPKPSRPPSLTKSTLAASSSQPPAHNPSQQKKTLPTSSSPAITTTCISSMSSNPLFSHGQQSSNISSTNIDLASYPNTEPQLHGTNFSPSLKVTKANEQDTEKSRRGGVKYPRTPVSSAPTNESAILHPKVSTPKMNPPKTSTANASSSIPPFSWDIYLRLMPAPVAPKEAFMQPVEYPVNLFKPGMKLEAKDSRSNSNWCLASVIYIEGLRLRLRFEGSDKMNDLFELIDSGNIRPVGSSPEEILSPPMNYQGNISTYTKYVEKQLTKPDTIIASPEFFMPPPQRPEKNLFTKGMKIEAIDRKNPYLICPATIGDVTGDDIHITFDGWRGSFDYTCKYYSRDLFPVNWCHDTGHNITFPNGWDGFFNGTPVKEHRGNSTAAKPSTPTPTSSRSKAKTSNSKTSATTKTTNANSKKAKASAKVIPVAAPVVQIDDEEQDEPKDDNEALNTTIEDDDLDNAAFIKNKFQCQRVVPYGDWLKSKKEPEQDEKGTDSSDAVLGTSFEISLPSQNESSKFQTKQQDSKVKKDAFHEEESVKRRKLEDSIASQHPTSRQSSSRLPPMEQVQAATTLSEEQSSKTKSIAEWTVTEVLDLIRSDESLEKYSYVFESNEIDGKALLLLTTDTMIKHMGLKIGPVLKINDLIDRIKKLN